PPDSPTATDVTENPETSEEVAPAPTPTNEDQDQATLEDVLNGSDSPRPVDPAIADKPVRVQLEMKERSWLRVTVDGQLDFEGVLDEGTQRTWAGETNVLVRVGNAGGVLAAFNESEAEIMGDPGSVQERLFSPDSPDPADSADSAEPD
ncbi:MAG: DUF4115 domain-containing protein, partial [Leptolyngbyaceae bacterium]|nr:DUF4115 domain-containing protein [Leptolyngbyaceae bacterium]